MASPKLVRSDAGRCGLRLGILAVIAVTQCVAVGAQDDSAPQAGKTALPGRIYIVAPIRSDVMHGLLAVDPNERTCATIDDKFVGFFPRVAPGGRCIAYSKPDPKTQKFTVVTLDLDQDQEQAQASDRAGIVCWASHGKELILSGLGPNGEPDEFGNWQIKADGSGREKLALPATELIWDWPSDGQWVLSASSRDAEGEELGLGASRRRALYTMRKDGRDATLIAPAGRVAKEGNAVTVNANSVGPRFSPDGREVAYITLTIESVDRWHIKNESRLWVVGRNGKDRRLVFEGNDEEGYPMSAAWSPDGGSLAVGLLKPLGESQRDGREHRLLIVDTDGKNPRQIPLPHPSNMIAVDWR